MLLTGQCIDDKRHPVQGLQLVLENLQHPHFQDSLVMQNLGYFQLKALPGVWSLRLADGRHSDIYAIVDRARNKVEVEALTRNVTSRPTPDPESASWHVSCVAVVHEVVAQACCVALPVCTDPDASDEPKFRP